MSAHELIKDLGLRHLSVRDVVEVEEAMNTMDEETMLMVVDKLIGQSKRSTKKKKTSTRG